ncbi:nucleotide disphospho-sugar-binding domain-containing protein [Streptomyces echinoruber]|uniref:UDP-glucosyltransferase YdhE n=1 Tax=Streptomyces echinoruber TaxID=68898 RepID=A0A918QST7_9ACTN|nr:nucleotide disphospho-sugar-binding domain-containing protein [Streptomyces echinoruber]GGZ70864.1 putative UDP-glucosyltransferase YdhE [Streptomyces echinoruber]
MRIAVVPIDAIGHMNPLLAVVAELAALPGVEEVRSFGPPALAKAFTAVGARHVSLAAQPLGPTPPGLSDLAYKSFVHPLATSRSFVDAVAAFRPDAVLYDVFSVHGIIAARTLRVPSASLVTFPGYGALGEDFALQHGRPHPALDEASDAYRRMYGTDLLGEGFLPTLFPSADLSVVTAAEELSREPDETTPRLLDALKPFLDTCVHVGAAQGHARYVPSPGAPEQSGRPERHRADFPFELLQRAKRDGRAVVLFSLGTVLTDFRFGTPVGGAPTGRDFLRAMLGHLTTALGGRADLTVVAAVGTRLSAEEEPRWPGNFLVRDFLPQREILDRYADVFVTHHGMNSTTEAILAGVPMVSLPGVGDQLANARTAVERGAAVAPWDVDDPYATVTAERLARAVDQALRDDRHRAACRELREAVLRAGGAPRAARLVAGLAQSAA